MGSNKNPEFKGRDPVLNKIMKVVNDAYPDGLVSLYWNNAKSEPVDSKSGDTLALFIATEVGECCSGLDYKEGLYEAIRVVGNAAAELDRVVTALEHEAEATNKDKLLRLLHIAQAAKGALASYVDRDDPTKALGAKAILRALNKTIKDVSR